MYADNVAHVYAHPQGLYGVIMSDKEYPSRVAFSLLNKILDEFLVKFPQDKWNPPMTYPELQNYLSKYQDPKQADSIMRVQNELDETTAILVNVKRRKGRGKKEKEARVNARSRSILDADIPCFFLLC